MGRWGRITPNVCDFSEFIIIITHFKHVSAKIYSKYLKHVHY